MTINLGAQNNSAESGTATLTSMSDSSVMVSVNLTNGTAEPQPAHIHKARAPISTPSRSTR